MIFSVKRALKWICLLLALITLFLIYNGTINLSLGSICDLFSAEDDSESENINDYGELSSPQPLFPIHQQKPDPTYQLEPGIFRKGNYTFIQIRQAANFTQLTNNFSICLATQTTIDRLNTISLQANYWRGPIELIVFLRNWNEIYIAKKYFKYLEQCNANSWYNSTVTVHVAINHETFLGNVTAKRKNESAARTLTLEDVQSAFRNEGDGTRDTSPGVSNLDLDAEIAQEISDKQPLDKQGVFSCSAAESDATMKSLMKQYLPEGPDPKFVYPQNHMRNYAKHVRIITKYTIISVT